MSNPSGKIVSLNVDYADEVLFCEDFGYTEYDEDKIRLLMERASNSGFNRMLWRVSMCGKVNYFSRVEDIYDYGQHNRKPISQDFDPLKVASAYARKYGMEIDAWMTLYDDSPMLKDGSDKMASVLCRTHPEWQMLSRDGKDFYQGVFCYAYPGVREHKLAMLAELVQYDIDGVFLSTRSHSRTPEFRKKSLEYIEGQISFEELNGCAAGTRDRFGFNDPVVEEYKKRYGTDIRNDEFDKVLWNSLRGEYLTGFLYEARRLLSSHDKRLCMMVKDEDRGDSRGGHRLGWILGDLYTDWEKWVNENIIDELCIYGEERETWWDFKNENWWDGALGFVETYRSRIGEKVKLLLWLDLWTWEWRVNPDYIARYGHPAAPWYEHPGNDTKPPKVIRKILDAALKSAADGVTLHEAQNMEWFSLWKSIKDVVVGKR